ncbi:MAG: c-type cytochrome [Pseudomonadota bacterium]
MMRRYRLGTMVVAGVAAVMALTTQSHLASADGLGYDGLPPQELCGLCHGLNGVSATARFPKLAGQKRAYIEKQLADFRAGRRANGGGQMANVITEISEDQYPEVALYFSQLPPPPTSELEGDIDPVALAAAQELFTRGDEARGIPACATCHVETHPTLSYAPHLTAQHPGYLEKQLSDFKSGERANDATGTMAAIAQQLSETEVAALAAYLGSMPRPAHQPGAKTDATGTTPATGVAVP